MPASRLRHFVDYAARLERVPIEHDPCGADRGLAPIFRTGRRIELRPRHWSQHFRGRFVQCWPSAAAAKQRVAAELFGGIGAAFGCPRRDAGGAGFIVRVRARALVCVDGRR